MHTETTTRTPEFLKAAEELMPILRKIPKEVIRRHNLLFEEIINQTIELQKTDFQEQTLTEILEMDLPHYKANGMKGFVLI